jgi:hypothetical protein
LFEDSPNILGAAEHSKNLHWAVLWPKDDQEREDGPEAYVMTCEIVPGMPDSRVVAQASHGSAHLGEYASRTLGAILLDVLEDFGEVFPRCRCKLVSTHL